MLSTEFSPVFTDRGHFTLPVLSTLLTGRSLDTVVEVRNRRVR